MLIVRGSVEETARKFGRTAEEVQSVLRSALAKLKRVRDRRPRPHLDDKMLTAWNGNRNENHCCYSSGASDNDFKQV